MAAIPFVDLQAQYRRIKASVDARIHKVLDHGRFILGPEVGELETALAASEAKFAKAFAASPDMMVIIDVETPRLRPRGRDLAGLISPSAADPRSRR